MSYAGVEREYTRRCSPGSHQWAFNGSCHICGVTEDHLIKEAEEILRRSKDGTLGKAAW